MGYEMETLARRGHPLSTYAKFSEKTDISNTLIRTRTCAYQGVRNVSFSENVAYVLNGWPRNGFIIYGNEFRFCKLWLKVVSSYVITNLLIKLFQDGGPYLIETIALICSANQWTGFYMIGTSVMKELNHTYCHL